MIPSSILVTGASRGIGYGLVKKFLEDKEIKFVFATARNPDEAMELKKLAAYQRLHIVQMDVGCDKSIQVAYNEIEKILGDDGLNLQITMQGYLSNTK